jgi:hypothetical protein
VVQIPAPVVNALRRGREPKQVAPRGQPVPENIANRSRPECEARDEGGTTEGRALSAKVVFHVAAVTAAEGWRKRQQGDAIDEVA